MTTAFVATIGGHVSELADLADRIDDTGDAVWITNDSPQTRDLLADRDVEMVPFIGERDRLGVLRAVPQARRILRGHGVERVVSTGSAIALAYLPVAAAMGIDAHYIESSTRVESCSITGRILSRTPGVHCYWQTDPAPAGFHSTGGVYDRYVATEVDGPSGLIDPYGRTRDLDGNAEQVPLDGAGPSLCGIERIVVTVGTTDRSFRRLIARLAELIPDDVHVLWQTGVTDVSGLGINAREMVPEAELVDAVRLADVVVTHAGAGSLALALRNGKAPVFVPRRAEYDEQIDDHQVELAAWAHRRGLAVHAEADRVAPDDLLTAARRMITTRPVGKLELE